MGLDPSAFGYVREDAGGTYFVTFTKTSVAEAPYKLTVAVNGLVTGSVEYENPGSSRSNSFLASRLVQLPMFSSRTRMEASLQVIAYLFTLPKRCVLQRPGLQEFSE